jgi:hypothetical protein
MLKDTFDFVNKVKDISSNNDPYILSFYIASLFTNIPTVETIEIILNRVFTDGITNYCDLTRDEFKRLLKCTNMIFEFNVFLHSF